MGFFSAWIVAFFNKYGNPNTIMNANFGAGVNELFPEEVADRIEVSGGNVQG